MRCRINRCHYKRVEVFYVTHLRVCDQYVKQIQLMHNGTMLLFIYLFIYLFNLSLQFIFSPTCFGNTVAIIKVGYIKLHTTMCIKM
jgi:hypothetical protein